MLLSQGNVVYVCGTDGPGMACTGPQLSQPISCMAAHGDVVFTAVGNDIVSWTRGKRVWWPVTYHADFICISSVNIYICIL